jgi:hypothetical protein
VLQEELRLVGIAEGMVTRGDPLTWERLDAILRNEDEQSAFLKDQRIDPVIRNEYADILTEAGRTLEGLDLWHRMQWYVMQCRFNPAFHERARRFWSYFTAPPSGAPPPSSGRADSV